MINTMDCIVVVFCLKYDWHDYTTSVDFIEWSIGYDFLSGVEEVVREVIEK